MRYSTKIQQPHRSASTSCDRHKPLTCTSDQDRPACNSFTPRCSLTVSHELQAAALVIGHIPGTSRRDLPRTDENCRDLSRRSDGMCSTFAMVRETLAQDPAYRPIYCIRKMIKSSEQSVAADSS
jgi:hypothetical protein